MPPAWLAKKSVSLSSAEAEYYGASLAAKEGIWLRDLLADFGFKQEGPTVLKLGSKSAHGRSTVGPSSA